MASKKIVEKEKLVSGKVTRINPNLVLSKFTLPDGKEVKSIRKLSTQFYIQEGNKEIDVRLPEKDISYIENNLLGKTVKYSYTKYTEIKNSPDIERLIKDIEESKEPEELIAKFKAEKRKLTITHHWEYNVKVIDPGETFNKWYHLTPLSLGEDPKPGSYKK
jgi:hypothetical protein